MRRVMVYSAGFPCQPWSAAGRGEGANDSEGRGDVFFYILEYLTYALPIVILLENVENLIVKHNEFFEKVILASLKSLGSAADRTDYTVVWRVRCTTDDGVPHRRPRVWIVCLRNDRFVNRFSWPKAIKPMTLQAVLGPPPKRSLESPDFYPTSQVQRLNLDKFRAERKKEGVTDIRQKSYGLDLDSSPGWFTWHENMIPTLTSSRGGGVGMFLTRHNRFTTARDMGLLQGFKHHEINQILGCQISETQAGKMFGNGYSRCSVERILGRCLLSTGLLSSFLDRWSGAVLLAEPRL